MQKLLLNTLTKQGEVDPGSNCTITISKEEYHHLPIIKTVDLGECIITNGVFKEIYRGHTQDNSSKHVALIIKVSENDNMPWNIVWVEREKLWIAFKYQNFINPSEAYGSTVEVAEPRRSDIYQINPYVAELLRQAYNINVALEKVYCNAPRY